MVIQLLNQRQKAFAEYYVNEGLAVGPAGVKAGYTKTYAYSQLSSYIKENIELSQYISELEEKAKKSRLLTRDEKREWLKSVIEDENAKMTDRLKAMDILNKMEAEYLERREVSGGFNLIVSDEI